MPIIARPTSAFVAASSNPNLARLDREVRLDPAITIALNGVSRTGDDVAFDFKAALGVGDVTALDLLVAAHTGEPLADPFTVDGTPIVSLDSGQTNHAALVAIAPLEGGHTVYTTHDFVDRCTHYYESARVVNEALVGDVTGLIWTSAHPFWIDMIAGRVQDDEGLIAEEQERTPGHHGWAVVVTADGAPLTQREPDEESGGDYSVHYETGTVTMFASRIGQDIRASYSYAQGTAWRMSPLPGKRLAITAAEAQFTENALMTDGIEFAVRAFAPPELGLPPGTRIEIPGAGTKYKRFGAIIDEAMGAFSVIPAIGGSPRGTEAATYGFPFHYATTRDLYAALGLEIIVRTIHGRVYASADARKARVTITFRFNSYAE